MTPEETPPKCEACPRYLISSERMEGAMLQPIEGEEMVMQHVDATGASRLMFQHLPELHARIAELEGALRVVASDIQLCGSCGAEARRVLGKEGGT